MLQELRLCAPQPKQTVTAVSKTSNHVRYIALRAGDGKLLDCVHSTAPETMAGAVLLAEDTTGYSNGARPDDAVVHIAPQRVW